MQTPLRIAFHGVNGSDAARQLIEEKVAWLERFCDRIISCRVVVEAPHRHHQHGNHFHLRIDLTVPAGEIVIDRDPVQRSPSPSLEAAIQHAFDVARRRLEEHFRRMRHEVKNHEEPPAARVSQLFAEQGYGFLLTPDGREVYFHRNAVLNGDFHHLQVGTEVSFVEEAGERGPQASTLRLIGRHNHPA